MTVNGISIKMYNGAESPLFGASQILIDLLGCNKLNECRFYKDNKKNEDFV